MQKLKSTLENYLFVLPAISIFTVFYIIPFFQVFRYALYDWDGILPTMTFVGLGNFKEIFLLDKVYGCKGLLAELSIR